WSKHETTDNDLKEWEKWPGVGVGIKCGQIVGADIDVTNEALALAIERATLKILGPAPCRIGNPPKRLLPYKITRAIKKIRDEYIDEDTGEVHAVEILGEGQQFVAEGNHPKTGNPYTWERGSLIEHGFVNAGVKTHHWPE
ncbi:MAG: hypothetical protein HOD33_09055, partial [Acidiferrobacteraceae bacterium]|nr:hypothetical protein [Acidiferrobacteraceae bacterium]